MTAMQIIDEQDSDFGMITRAEIANDRRLSELSNVAMHTLTSPGGIGHVSDVIAGNVPILACTLVELWYSTADGLHVIVNDPPDDSLTIDDAHLLAIQLRMVLDTVKEIEAGQPATIA